MKKPVAKKVMGKADMSGKPRMGGKPDVVIAIPAKGDKRPPAKAAGRKAAAKAGY